MKSCKIQGPQGSQADSKSSLVLFRKFSGCLDNIKKSYINEWKLQSLQASAVQSNFLDDGNVFYWCYSIWLVTCDYWVLEMWLVVTALDSAPLGKCNYYPWLLTSSEGAQDDHEGLLAGDPISFLALVIHNQIHTMQLSKGHTTLTKWQRPTTGLKKTSSC